MRSRSSRRLCATLCALFACAACGNVCGASAPDAGPAAERLSLDSPIWAGIGGHAFTLTGSGLTGEDDAPAMVTLNTQTLQVRSSASTRLIVDLPLEATSGTLVVEDPAGRRAEAQFDVYAYRSYDVPPTEGTAGAPLAVAIDEQNRIFLNEEFHRAIHFLDASDIESEVQQVLIPYPDGDGPFASTVLGDRATTTSILGEDIEVAPDGSIWFTEGGALAYEGAFENHSRVVRYAPDQAGAFSVYNVPGDRNEVIGVAHDPVRNRIWFAEGGLGQAALWSFDPGVISPDNTFDFSTSLDDQVCAPGDIQSNCFTRYPLENANAYPAHLLVDDEGLVWFTHFWGTALGVLDPDANTERTFPLPASTQTIRPFIGSGPWALFQDRDGHIVLNEFFDAAVIWFDKERAANGACEALNDEGDNPCILETVETTATTPYTFAIHSIAEGRDGRVWLSAGRAEEDEGSSGIGFIADRRTVVWLPPIDDLADHPDDAPTGQAGITVDLSTGDVYVAEFWRDRIGRFTRVP